MSAAVTVEPPWKEAVGTSFATLTRIAGYTLPTALDRRILELGERKETLNADERAELLAWADFIQHRSLEKFQAEIALRRLASICPELAG